MSVTLAVHQPNYLPWLGWFHKLAAADVFVYLDAVQFPRGRSFAARNRIKTPNGVAWLTVPVSVPKGREGKATYGEVGLAEPRWREKHLRTVETSYARAPHFDDVFELYRTGLEAGISLLDVNLALLEGFADYLGIGTRRVVLSELLPEFGQKTELIVEACTSLGADEYLSGSGGGADYNDETRLAEAGIALRYDAFEPAPYPQLWGEFVPGLSTLDALMNCGPDARALLR